MPKMPSRWIFSVEGKDIRGVWNPSQSFIPPVTEQLSRLSSSGTRLWKNPDQPELENIYILQHENDAATDRNGMQVHVDLL